jgi:hypothetical protein
MKVMLHSDAERRSGLYAVAHSMRCSVVPSDTRIVDDGNNAIEATPILCKRALCDCFDSRESSYEPQR